MDDALSNRSQIDVESKSNRSCNRCLTGLFMLVALEFGFNFTLTNH